MICEFMKIITEIVSKVKNILYKFEAKTVVIGRIHVNNTSSHMNKLFINA